MVEKLSVAQAFVAARRSASAFSVYPGTRPVDLAEAYRVQEEAITIAGGEVVGWKVGRINPPLDHQLGSNRLAGPIFAHQTRFAPDRHGPAMPVFADGTAAAEAEYLIRIGRDAPVAAALTLDAAAELIDAVHVGIEIASSPYSGINADGPLVTISDFGNNNGLVIGPAIPDWRSLDFIDCPVELRIDGAVAGSATARTMLDGPIGAVAFLARCLADRGRVLTAGSWVSSGAVTGVHVVAPGAVIEAAFGDLRVGCTITAAEGEMEQAEEAVVRCVP
jgi:2-keto-4-pentenoate hydratase